MLLAYCNIPVEKFPVKLHVDIVGVEIEDRDSQELKEIILQMVYAYTLSYALLDDNSS